jgi:hypothetical protein
MLESEVKPLISFVSRRSEIIQPLTLRHGRPFLLAVSVTSHEIHLGKKIDDYIHTVDAEKRAIATDVTRGVIYQYLVYQETSESNLWEQLYLFGRCWRK